MGFSPLALILVCAFCAWVVNSQQTSDAQAAATQQAQDNADATATALAPTPTTEDRILRILGWKSSDAGSIVYDNGDVTITITLGEQWSNKTARTTIEYDTFDIESRIWTSHLHPKSVTVIINGQLVDKYGATSTGLYAKATLTSETANLFHWDVLDSETAWAAYDSTWMRDDIQNA